MNAIGTALGTYSLTPIPSKPWKKTVCISDHVKAPKVTSVSLITLTQATTQRTQSLCWLLPYIE